ncbi:hypothetical protein [Moraxella bovis]|uniref:Uncharacterized protein n=1 Tax=Moraxella bovis TaxID=476 RepID=A0A378PP41_MORBO|nr:hypothetical protein [Moraxella bovis]STY88596.1 Uncharacterised protein [Moraxella bovis]
MGKLGNLAYNIGTSLNKEDINTHRQGITPTTQTLQNLSNDEQLAYHAQNQALLDANQERLSEKMESDGVWSYEAPGINGEACTGVECSDRQIIAQLNACKRDASQCRDYPEHLKVAASILAPTTKEEVAFIVATAGGGYALKVAGKAGVKVIRSFKSGKELDEAMAEAKRVSRTDTKAGYEPDNDLLSSQASKKARDEKLIKDAENISTAKPNGRPPQVTAPRNIQEQILWSEVVKNPKTAGKPLNGMNNDSRFPKDAGFQKMEAKMRSNDGKAVVIHYQYNHKTNKAYDIKITSVE